MPCYAMPILRHHACRLRRVPFFSYAGFHVDAYFVCCRLRHAADVGHFSCAIPYFFAATRHDDAAIARCRLRMPRRRRHEPLLLASAHSATRHRLPPPFILHTPPDACRSPPPPSPWSAATLIVCMLFRCYFVYTMLFRCRSAAIVAVLPF